MLNKILPPFIKTYIIRKQRFGKQYKNYAEALAKCDTYEQIELCETIVDKTLLAINSWKFPTNTILFTALSFLLNKYNMETIECLDFGGACGAHYFEMKNFFKPNILRWNIVETRQMILSANKGGIMEKNLTFYNNIFEVKKLIDFIYAPSSLQYTPDPFYYLKELLNLKPKIILFDRMEFGDKTYVTIQKSMLSENGIGKLPNWYIDKEVTYPITIMSYKKFEEIMFEKKYYLIYSMENKTLLYAHLFVLSQTNKK